MDRKGRIPPLRARGLSVWILVFACLWAALPLAAQTLAAPRVHSFRLDRPRWMWSSIPYADTSGTKASSLPADHARIYWYNARGVRERDLDPTLTTEQGGDKEREVLELSVQPNATAGSALFFTVAAWAGVTQRIGVTVIDTVRHPVLEIWVNDWRADHTTTRGIFHLDLGVIDEDAFWQADAPPNAQLDTEDKNRNLILDADEDTGLDGLFDGEEPGYDPAGNADPNGDDFYYSLSDPEDYSRINGTEGNGFVGPGAGPDTEDLNRNNFLDRQNDYFEASIDLADSAFVAVDVPRDYAGDPAVKPDNGWRLFRIPIAGLDSTGAGARPFRRMGDPDWGSVEALRLWLSGLEGNGAGPFDIQIGGIRVLDDLDRLPPAAIRALPSVPNPFRDRTLIRFELPRASQVRVRVYDVRGRFLAEVFRGDRPAGSNQIYWDGRDAAGRAVSSGTYFVRIEAGGMRASRIIVRLR